MIPARTLALLARAALAAALAAALTGCHVEYMHGPASMPGKAWGESIGAGGSLVAGVARRDITPPPGLSLLGHGPEGRVAAGTLLRLYCTAFVIARGHEAIALLPCDLQAPSLELQRTIAELVARQDPRLGADRIFLMASHTHAGPGHYFGARQYGGTFSSRAPGFDRAVLDFLAGRAAEAVLEAAQRVRRAEIGWRIDPCAGGGLVKNRSLPALVRNPTLPAALRAQILRGCNGFLPVQDVTQGVAPADRDRLAPAELAADLRLSVLRIDQISDGGARQPLAAFGVFGVHNTAIPNDNDLYHADVFGFAVREAEAEIRRSLAASGAGAPPVLVALANGIEGDLSPDTTSPSIPEARRLGEELGLRVARTFLRGSPTLRDDGVIARAYREIELPGAVAAPAGGAAAPAGGAAHTPRLCDAPEIGAAAAGGAEDGPTWLRIFPQMKEGARAAEEDPCHGRKLVLRSPQGRFAADGLDFPNVAPISLVRLGGALLATTPFEMTTVVGYRIREHLAALVHPDRPDQDHDVILVGLTNSYLQYVTTAEEYAIQHYEGASTLYGPHTAELLRHHLACLSRAVYPGSASGDCGLGPLRRLNTIYPVAFAPDQVSRMPKDTGGAELPPAQELEVFRSLTDLWPSYFIRWSGVPGGFALGQAAFSVRVVDAEGALLDDDRGTGMEVRFEAARTGAPTWVARWTPRWTPAAHPCDHGARFEIVSRSKAGQLRSRLFRVECATTLTERAENPGAASHPGASPGAAP